jgi:hypothetical protein
MGDLAQRLALARPLKAIQCVVDAEPFGSLMFVA